MAASKPASMRGSENETAARTIGAASLRVCGFARRGAVPCIQWRHGTEMIDSCVLFADAGCADDFVGGGKRSANVVAKAFPVDMREAPVARGRWEYNTRG